MPKTIYFTDESRHPTGDSITGWLWDFGDGDTSTLQNPTHDYDAPGVYDVQLTVSTSTDSDDVTKSVNVSISELTALFSAAATGLAVDFTDHSTPNESGPITDWDWDFGDGGTSTSENPSHTYAAAGVYTVTLTVTGTDSETDEISHNVAVAVPSTLTALFDKAISGSLVSFDDNSTPGPSGPITAWDWDFGDGSAHGTTANPTHNYNDAGSGTYTVTLTVTGTSGDGTDDISHDIDVTVPTSSGGTEYDQFIAASDFARPAFTPTRIVRFKDKATFDAALADLQAGDYVKYDPNFFGLSNQKLPLGKYTINGKSMSKRTVIDFGCSRNVWDNSKITPNYVAFSNTVYKDDALIFSNNKNLDIWGGDYYGAHGAGFRIMGDNIDCQLLDLYCHDIGGSGVMVQPIDAHTGASKTQDGLVIRAEINRFCMDPSTDPHAQKGTGHHGAIHHGNSGHLDNCHFYYYAHDPLRPGEISFGKAWPSGGGGSACEPGTDNTGTFASQDNNYYTVYGENLLMDIRNVNPGDEKDSSGNYVKQTGGNILNNWGSVPMNGMVCPYLGAKKITGNIMHGAGGGWSSASPAIRVLVGRGQQTNLIVYRGNIADRYVTGKGIVYVDCT